MANLIDDTLPGGPRWMDNLGHEPVWVETRTQLKRLLAERGLKLRETNNYNRKDQSPWATPTRLRSGVEITPYLYGLASEVTRPRVPLVRPRAEETLLAGDVRAIQDLEAAVTALGYRLGIRCDRCMGTVEGGNARVANTWHMTCPCRRLTYDSVRPHPVGPPSAARGGGSDLGGG